MMRILEPQLDEKFVGRTEELQDLAEIIHTKNRNIIIVTGEKGIGKTNFLKVAAKKFKEQQYEIEYFHGGLVKEEAEEQWFNSFSRVTSLSLPIIGGGIGWKEKTTMGRMYSYLSKLKNQTIIFIEDAHKEDKQFLELIQRISEINPNVFFVLEVPIEHSKKINLKPGSYSIIHLKRLSQEQVQELVTRAFPQLSQNIVSIITSLSEGVPYIARILAYICNKKNSEDDMIKFLFTLRDPETQTTLNKIHQEVLENLSGEARKLVKRLVFAPKYLTLKLINAFGEGIENLKEAFRELREKGVLVQEELPLGLKTYHIYHSLFDEYIKDQYPLTSREIAEMYQKATKLLNSKYPSEEIYFENSMLVLRIMEFEMTKRIEHKDILAYVVPEIKDPSILLRAAKEYWLTGRPDKSLGILAKLLEILDEKKDPILYILTLQHMGVAYRLIGKIDEALITHEKALRICQRISNEKRDKEVETLISQQYINIGNIYIMKNELEKAEESFRKALSISENIGDTERQISAILSLGSIQEAKGDIKKALELYLKALKLINDLEDSLERSPALYTDLDDIQRRKGFVYLGLSKAYYSIGRKDKSIKYMILALSEFKENGYIEGLFQAILTLGNIFEKENNFILSLACYKFLINTSQQFNVKSPTITIAHNKLSETIKTAILLEVYAIDIERYILNNIFSVLSPPLLGPSLVEEYKWMVEKTLNNIPDLQYAKYTREVSETIINAYLEIEENPEIISVISNIWANPSVLTKLLTW